jgi:hypothetical protein
MSGKHPHGPLLDGFEADCIPVLDSLWIIVHRMIQRMKQLLEGLFLAQSMIPAGSAMVGAAHKALLSS